MSVVAPIASACAVVPVAVGLGRGEQPGVAQVVGVVAAVVGVGLAVYERKNTPQLVGTIEVGAGVPPEPRPTSDGPRNRLGALLAVTAALCFGATLVGFSETAKYDPFWPAVGGRLTSVAMLLLLAPMLRERTDGLLTAGGGLPPGREPRRGPHGARSAVGAKPGVHRLPAGARLMTMTAGLFHLGAATLFSVASTRGLLSLVAVLSSLAAVVTVGLAFLVLGERLGRQQLAGVALALAGVLAIAGG
jgi:drug/metabolite transporter (DMT)-like permease